MLRCLLLVCSLSLGLVAYGQLKFDNPVYDFGTLKEEVNSAEVAFTFTNTTGKTVTLVDVKASCGCTTPRWSNQPIANGQKGEVVAAYSTVNRPGPFDKTVTVKYKLADDATEQFAVLRFKGTVTPRVKTLSDYYPIKYGRLRLSTNHVALGRAYNGSQRNGSMVIYNSSDRDVTLKQLSNDKPHISYDFRGPVVLHPKDSLRVNVKWDGTKLTDWGFVHFMANLSTDDDSMAIKTLYVSAQIEEDFSNIAAEERAKLQKVQFEKTEFDFGSIAQGSKVEHDFKFTNTGSRDLIIRKTQASCGCTATQPEKTTLKPGESSFIHVVYDSTGKPVGNEYKSVSVVTNDPQQQMITLVIKGKITAGSAGQPAAGH